MQGGITEQHDVMLQAWDADLNLAMVPYPHFAID